MDLQLSGKRAIVTGGATGIGFAIAAELSREGAHIAIASRRMEVLEPSAARIGEEMGHPILPVVADTGDDASVQALAETVAQAFGGIDIPANVASQNPAQPGG